MCSYHYFFALLQNVKTAQYYKAKPSEIDASKLTVIPEAPRISKSAFPKNWSWRSLESEDNMIQIIQKTPSIQEDNSQEDEPLPTPESTEDSQDATTPSGDNQEDLSASPPGETQEESTETLENNEEESPEQAEEQEVM